MKATIIVPTFNAAREIKHALESWASQDFPAGEFEILIIDNFSTDGTKELVEELSKKYHNIKYVADKSRPSAARNLGIKLAGGETVIFFDNDSVAQQNYLKTLFKFLADHPEIDIVGGPQTNSAEGSFFARAGGATLTSFFGTFTMSSRYKKTKLNLDADEFSLTTANVAIRKKVFDNSNSHRKTSSRDGKSQGEIFHKIAPFNTNIYPGEDPELFARAKNNGFRIAFNPEIAVMHGRRPTLKAFCKMFFVYGRTRVIKEQATPTPFPKSLLFALPSLFLISLFALPLLGYFTKLFLLPFAAYILAAVGFSLEAAIYNRIPLALPVLPFLFFCVHVCYGAGYLVGLTKKKQKFDAHDVYKGDT